MRSELQGTDVHTHFYNSYTIMALTRGTQNGKNVMDHRTLQSAGSFNRIQAKVQYIERITDHSIYSSPFGFGARGEQ